MSRFPVWVFPVVYVLALVSFAWPAFWCYVLGFGAVVFTVALINRCLWLLLSGTARLAERIWLNL